MCVMLACIHSYRKYVDFCCKYITKTQTWLRLNNKNVTPVLQSKIESGNEKEEEREREEEIGTNFESLMEFSNSLALALSHVKCV